LEVSQVVPSASTSTRGMGMSLYRLDGQTSVIHFRVNMLTRKLTPVIRNKAVADGAVAYYIDHTASSRVSRFTYGIKGIARTPLRTPSIAPDRHRS
jgi:hypothetical protein